MAHILVVDDERDIVHMVSRILVEKGHQVSSARTGEQALEFLRSETVDLMVVDRALPLLSGDDVRKRIRADQATARLPILTMTAVYVRLPDADEAIESGLDEFLFKPFMAETLIDNVNRLLTRRWTV
jgi:DNA-binding response OmpR family regulator